MDRHSHLGPIVSVDESNVIDADNVVANGVVHVIDGGRSPAAGPEADSTTTSATTTYATTSPTKSPTEENCTVL